jgi:hypothetical protein
MIAISYRRADSAAITGRVYDRLESEFGRDSVFMDFDSIPYGVDFREHIRDALRKAEVLVVMIGPGWTGRTVIAQTRLHDPGDFVRLEIAEALQRDIPVIPVLIDHTPMPTADSLPEEIRPFAFRNGMILDAGVDFRHHVDRLVAAIKTTSGLPGKLDQRKKVRFDLHRFGRPARSILGASVLTATVVLGLYLLIHRHNARNSTQSAVGDQTAKSRHQNDATKESSDAFNQKQAQINQALLGQCAGDAVRIVVSIPKQRAWLLCNEQVVADVPISSGKPGYQTPRGYFTVLEKDANHISTIYGDSVDAEGRLVEKGNGSHGSQETHFAGGPMKWFLRLNSSGIGMYSGLSPDLPDHPVTHGGILLSPAVAKLFFEHSQIGTHVDVVDQAFEGSAPGG